MLGTIINTLSVAIGGALGLGLGRYLKESLQDSVLKATGLAVLFLGISGSLEHIFIIQNNQLTSQGAMMMIISLAFGAFLGELLGIETLFERFGEWLKKITRNNKDSSFVDAFVTSSLTVCIGAMAIVGAITEGLTGDASILIAKSILDFIIVFILATSQGKGSLFAAVPIFLFEGGITLGARFIEPIMTDLALSYLSLVGSILIFCVGVNLIWGKLFKVANFLPAILIAVCWALFYK